MSPQTTSARLTPTKEAITAAAIDQGACECRSQLARFSAEVFLAVGTELEVMGHIIGSDRFEGRSPFGHGDDETVAVSLLLRIASQLVSASNDLFNDGRRYAAAALLRQMVEVEYLAWAFSTRDGDGDRWLRSTKEERQEFFSPAKLRRVAQGTFRSQDYGYHCELGGHPVPGAGILLEDKAAIAQLLLSDLLGHAGRIWDYLVGWAQQTGHGASILRHAGSMSRQFADWKSRDALVDLLPPP